MSPSPLQLVKTPPDEAAAQWLVRVDRGSLSTAEEEAFEAWLSEDPANAAAYERASSAWEAFEGAETDPEFEELRDAALAERPKRARPWWIPAGAAIAASIAGTILLLPENAVRWIAPQSHVPSGQSAPKVEQGPRAAVSFATVKGERRVVRLPDGSSATLNTDTAITLAYSAGQRLIHLVRGQALFDVVHNSSRQFVVEVDGRQIADLGTLFEVRLDPGRVKVVLVRGKVVVTKSSDLPGAAIKPTVLQPGQALVEELGAARRVVPADISSELLWKDGLVEFHDDTLAAAVAEVNRYSQRQIVIADSSIAQMRLSGVFKTGDPERFSSLVAELLPVTATASGNGNLALVAKK